MTLETVLWVGAGFTVGTLHALLLWRSSQFPRRVAGSAVLRLLSVAATLLGAALLNQLLPVAAGWACAFPVSVAGVCFRGRP